MIPSYRDLAANERTFLAWIRTAITIMALGFVIERLDLLLASLGGEAAAEVPPHPPQIHYLSVVLISVAVVLIGSATYGFNRTYRAILSEQEVPLKGTALPTAMALVLLAVGIGLMLYLLRLL